VDVLVHTEQLAGNGVGLGAAVGVGGDGDAGGVGPGEIVAGADDGGVAPGCSGGVGEAAGCELEGALETDGVGADGEAPPLIEPPGVRPGPAGTLAPILALGAKATPVPPRGPGPGDVAGPTAPLTAITVAAAAATKPVPEAAHPQRLISRATVGIWPIHAPNPMVRQRRPTEMLRKARTMAGSSCVPATRTSSSRAAVTLIERLYGRGAVITS
jgi:hypothetical protein